jgi:hypothetical protein
VRTYFGSVSHPLRALNVGLSGWVVCQRRLLPARCDETAFVGEGDELCAIVAVELGEDAADACLGGERADDEPLGDVRVGEAGGVDSS